MNPVDIVHVELHLCPSCNAFVNTSWVTCLACGAALGVAAEAATTSPEPEMKAAEVEPTPPFEPAHRGEAEFLPPEPVASELVTEESVAEVAPPFPPAEDSEPEPELASVGIPTSFTSSVVVGDQESGYVVRWGAAQDRSAPPAIPSVPSSPLVPVAEVATSEAAPAAVVEPAAVDEAAVRESPADALLVEPASPAAWPAAEEGVEHWEPPAWQPDVAAATNMDIHAVVPPDDSAGFAAPATQPHSAPLHAPQHAAPEFDFSIPPATSASGPESGPYDPAQELQTFRYDSSVFDLTNLQSSDGRIKPALDKRVIIALAIAGPLIVVIGLVVFGVVGGSSKDEVASGTTTSAPATTTTIANEASNGWVRFKDPAGSFSVDLPAEPAMSNTSTADGPMSVYQSSSPDNHYVVVLVKATLPSGPDWKNNQEVLKNALRSTSSTSGMEIKGQITERRAGTMYLDATLSNGTASTNVRYFVEGNTMYGLSITSDSVNGNPEAYDQLTKSFKLGVSA